MKKTTKVVGYQPDRLCTLKDLQTFDDIWWASKPNPEVTPVNLESTFKVTPIIKQAFASSFHFISSLPKL